jgi:hypothetical protein
MAGLGVSGVLQMFGSALGEVWQSILADRNFVIAVGAYTGAAAPYAWTVARDWLVTHTDEQYTAYQQTVVSSNFARPINGQPSRYVPIRRTVLATIGLGPFIGPIGIAIDIARIRQLLRDRRFPATTRSRKMSVARDSAPASAVVLLEPGDD